jgi:DNA-binding transcriptional ArsR family regulator
MTKTWDTKKKILDMLLERRMTLTELSRHLNLAPSTVNQHIKELIGMDAIRQVDNPFIMKWKYYEANRAFKGIDALKATRLSDVPLFEMPKNPVWHRTANAVVVVMLLGVLISNAFVSTLFSGISSLSYYFVKPHRTRLPVATLPSRQASTLVHAFWSGISSNHPIFAGAATSA